MLEGNGEILQVMRITEIFLPLQMSNFPGQERLNSSPSAFSYQTEHLLGKAKSRHSYSNLSTHWGLVMLNDEAEAALV